MQPQPAESAAAVTPGQAVGGVPSALRIFEVIAMNEPVTTAELACLTGTDERSLHDHLTVLAYANWISLNGSHGRWQVSSIPVGFAMQSDRLRLLDRAANQMVQLRRIAKHSVFLCAPEGQQMVVLDVASCSAPFRKECGANENFSMCSTSGMAIRLAMSKACLMSGVDCRQRNSTDMIAADVMIRETRQFVGFAVALRDQVGFPFATLGIAVPPIRATSTYRARMHACLVKAVLRCSEPHGAGGTIPPVPALRTNASCQ
jgi:DNA-binding IclR family transcriptional regulator